MLLVRSQQAEAIMVKRLNEGRNNETTDQGSSEPRSRS